MIKCKICGKEFKNNFGGNLTKHLKLCHNLSMEDYYIKTVLNGKEPKCKCGLCDERPNFYRGKFKKYAIGHERFEWQEKKYIKIYGQPKCENPECNNVVHFHRGSPNKYCSSKCQPSRWNQEKVRETVKKRYNVENVFQMEYIKEKSIETLKAKYGVEHALQSKVILKKMVKENNKKYNVDYLCQLPHIKQKKKETLLKIYGVDHFSKTKEFRALSSKNMCKYNQDILTNHMIKRYKGTHLYYQSQYEYRFLEYCEKNNLLHYLDNSPTFKYLNSSLGKWHLPDFKFKEKFIIEIKSAYWMERQGGWNKIGAKKESVEKMGYKYIFILDEDYSEFLKIL